ncbi:MAG: response regulator [Solirubrobacterales bacterium]|nr:response regulator [Solirubrobacterales bacterium]
MDREIHLMPFSHSPQRIAALPDIDVSRVLLVEDSRAYAQLVEDMLEESHAGSEIVHGRSVAEAASLLAREQFDCVLMDLGLPDASGLTGMRRLLELAPGVPVVVLTGRDDDEVGLEAVREGAQDYLVKSRSDGPLISRAIRYAIERKLVELELADRAAQIQAFAERQRDFVASASHELRTPLTSILGYLELVLEDPDADRDEQRGHVEVAYRNSRRLLSLVEDLLTVNKLESGNLGLSLEDLPLIDLVRAVEEVGLGLCARAGLTLRITPPAAAVSVRADRARVTEVLDNLIGNAVKFTPRGGEVALETRVEDQRVLLAVSDTGVGIAAHELPSVFDRFFRSPDSVRRAIPGTGLGLSIARSLMELQGGDITVSSSVGAGTTFTISLPLSPDDTPWHAS